MRTFDRLLGAPLCFALSLLPRPGFVRRSRGGTVRRLLVVKLVEQGSTVLAAPALRRAVEALGRENVFVLVLEENRHILDIMQIVPRDRVVTIPGGSLPVMLRGALKALRRLRGERLDAAVDLEFFARASVALARLSGAPRIFGLRAAGTGAPYRGRLITDTVAYDPGLHAEQLFGRLMDAALPQAASGAGPAAGGTGAAFHPSENDRWEVAGLLGESTRGPLVVLNSNAGDLVPQRRWPPERYVSLARRLLGRYPELTVVFTGTPGERESVHSLVEEVGDPRCLSLAGRTGLRQLLALFCRARLLVTNDSGPAHFASLTPVRVITLFGPESPRVFAATSPRNRVIWAGLPCSPCLSVLKGRLSECRDNLCMKAISEETVFQAACEDYEAGEADRR